MSLSFHWPPAKGRPLKKDKEERRLVKGGRISDSLPGPQKQEKKEETSVPRPQPKEPAPPSKPMESPPFGQIPYQEVGWHPAPAMPPTRQPSPPRVPLNPSVPPQSQMMFDYTEKTLPKVPTYPSQPLEFIGSKPAVESRDPSGSQYKEKRPQYVHVPPGGWENHFAKPALNKNKSPLIERRRSDSQGKATSYRSSSPVVSVLGGLTLSNENTLPEERDRPLSLRLSSNNSRNEHHQQQQSDPAKMESAPILDELMNRYERKEAEMRKTHEKELRKLQEDHEQTVDRLKEELSVAKMMHADEMDQLKQETQKLDSNLQKAYTELMYHDGQRKRVSMEKAKQEAELQKEREEKDRLIAEMNTKYETLDKKTRSQIDGLEREVRAMKDHCENQMANLVASYENEIRARDEMHRKAASQSREESDVQITELRKQVAELNSRLATQTEEMNKIQAEKRALQEGTSLIRKECNDLTARYSKQKEEASKREGILEEERKKVMDQCARRIKEARDEGDKQRDILQKELQAQQVALIHDMEMRTDKLRRDHCEHLAAATLDLRQRILSLESDLIDNGDDMRPSLGGGALQTRYRALKLKVETISEPFNLSEIASPSGFDTSELDQREFLAREGKSQMRFLLRSVCWSVLLDRFFSSPFGFGAFGREEGKKMLLEVYATWQRLFDPGFTGYISAPELRDQEDFEPFYNDKFANWWRSATFQSIQSVVFSSRRASQAGKPAEPLDENGSSRGGPQGIVKAFADNREEAKRHVLDVITKVCKVDKANEAIEREVDEMVDIASLLAVEFGAHGAKICFGMPTYGDTVQIGAEFVDCEDGDANRGKLETVELAVAPSLFMIGDGRKDLTTATCLYPGEIYPRRGD